MFIDNDATEIYAVHSAELGRHLLEGHCLACSIHTHTKVRGVAGETFVLLPWGWGR